MQIAFFILAALVGSLLVIQINQRVASPLLSIADRWLRWIVSSIGGAWICLDFELIDRPFWAVATAFFILWFVCEACLNWLRVHAFSVSPLPLFHRYEMNRDGDEWPIQPRLLKLREWLRGQGFKSVQALKAEIGGGIYLRVSIYENQDATIRLQITFIPQPNGGITVCSAFTSVTAEGSRFVTDNLYVPFAGFYPEHWFVERSPWRRSLARLLKRHRSRLAHAGAVPVPIAIDPLSDFNDSQRELDRVNTELGFLNNPPQREDLGKITQEGRYRVWKEIWMLNYLGRAMRYE